MSDDPVITKLRGAARGGAPATLAHATAAVTRGRRIRRRRQAAAALGSGITVAGFVAVLVLASPTGQSVVQTPGPATAGRTPDPQVASSGCTALEQERGANVARLRDSLGPRDWQPATAPQPGNCVIEASLQAAPGSGPAVAVPAGDELTAVVNVIPSDENGYQCTPAAKNAPPTLRCTTLQSADGHTVTLYRTQPMQEAVAAGNAHQPTVATEGARAVYTRPDGTSALVSVDVQDPDATSARWQQVNAWLDSYAGKLADAATDPTLSGSAAMRSRDAAAADLDRFRDHLGPGWQVAHNPQSNMTEVQPVPGSATADGLPAGYAVQARLETHEPDDPMFKNECAAFVEKGTTFAPCTAQQTPDGKTVRVQQQHTVIAETDKQVWDAIRVTYNRPDGSHEMVELGVYEDKSKDSVALQKQAVEWLNTYLDKLMATATDPAIGTGQPAQ